MMNQNKKENIEIGKLPIKNIKGRPLRTAALLLIVGFLALSIFAGSMVVSSLNSGLASLEDRLGADVIVVPGDTKQKVNLENILLQGTPGYFYMDKAVEDEIRNLDTVEGIEAISSQLYLASAKSGCCTAKVQIIGYDPNTDFTIKPWIQQVYSGNVGEGEIVIGSDISPNADGTMLLYDKKVKVISQLDKTGTGLDTAVYCNDDTLKELIDASVAKGMNTVFKGEADDVISSVYIKVKDGYDVQSVADEINMHVRHVDAISSKSMINGVSDSLAGVASSISLMMVAIWLLALIILIIAFTALIGERKREFAVLRVLGASRSMLAKMVLKESMFLSLLGGLAGVAIGCLIFFPFNKAIEMKLGLPFLTPSVTVILILAIGTMAVSLVAGAGASSIAAWKLSKVDAGNTLREGN